MFISVLDWVDWVAERNWVLLLIWMGVEQHRKVWDGRMMELSYVWFLVELPICCSEQGNLSRFERGIRRLSKAKSGFLRCNFPDIRNPDFAYGKLVTY